MEVPIGLLRLAVHFRVLPDLHRNTVSWTNIWTSSDLVLDLDRLGFSADSPPLWPRLVNIKENSHLPYS